jgi:predicted transcriptional regulator
MGDKLVSLGRFAYLLYDLAQTGDSKCYPFCVFGRVTVGRRDSVLIILEILRLVRKEPAGITRIVYGSNLSHLAAEKYLGALSRKGLVTMALSAEGRAMWSITDRGVEALRDLERALLKLMGDEV